jgi:hypothetical protein
MKRLFFFFPQLYLVFSSAESSFESPLPYAETMATAFIDPFLSELKFA